MVSCGEKLKVREEGGCQSAEGKAGGGRGGATKGRGGHHSGRKGGGRRGKGSGGWRGRGGKEGGAWPGRSKKKRWMEQEKKDEDRRYIQLGRSSLGVGVRVEEGEVGLAGKEKKKWEL
ncbi:hypothetical protein Pcinc_040217 [Petrolisthes cinctipes]|uniref:Uncharacterized protein n=1 Tax=Petrolisthes cinctipes TaxID=88211 RepID=A0AAE1EI99_PETCI|nr:hypothetical protein Pcinc_040217 [Petrolisthes cinctipes]